MSKEQACILYCRQIYPKFEKKDLDTLCLMMVYSFFISGRPNEKFSKEINNMIINSPKRFSIDNINIDYCKTKIKDFEKTNDEVMILCDLIVNIEFNIDNEKRFIDKKQCKGVFRVTKDGTTLENVISD